MGKAYDEGRDAYDNGPQHSPYDRGTEDCLNWCNGWDSRADEDIVVDDAAAGEYEHGKRQWYEGER